MLRVEPKGRGEGIEFVSEIKGGTIPQEYIPAIEKGYREAAENGVLAGFPMVDIKCAVYDGSFHDVDSSEIAFKIAGSMAFQDAVKRAGLVLLEPIMHVAVSTPSDFVGDVIGDLSSRRAQIQETETRGVFQVINALVPLAELQGYATALRSMSQGRANSMLNRRTMLKSRQILLPKSWDKKRLPSATVKLSKFHSPLQGIHRAKVLK